MQFLNHHIQMKYVNDDDKNRNACEPRATVTHPQRKNKQILTRDTTRVCMCVCARVKIKKIN